MGTNRMLAAASAAVLMSALAAGPAEAAVVTVTGVDSFGRAASATFDNNTAGFLTVKLTNTASADVIAPSFVLTALFFDLNATLSTTGASALIASDSASWDLQNVGTQQDPIWQGVLTDPAGTNVGGEWAYVSGLVGAPNGATKGLGSAGFGLFGDPNLNGVSLDPPDALNGVNYGITSAGDDVDTGNGDIRNGGPLIKNSVVFMLAGTVSDEVLRALSNVSFQYGTSLSEPNLQVPIPAAGWLLLSGLGGLGLIGRRRKLA